MFEGIASTIIVKLLGDYIENLDSKSLKIAIWSGSINLTNLTLKASALDTFDLPVSVVQGCVGSIDASIPWQSLSSSPVIAKVSDVFLVVQPKKCDHVGFLFGFNNLEIIRLATNHLQTFSFVSSYVIR